MKSYLFRSVLGVAVAGVLGSGAWASTLIVNARVIDGSGAPARSVSVRIDEDRIVAVGRLKPVRGEAIVDAKGLTLAPGFIDAHSHHDRQAEKTPDMTAVTAQGVTTIVVGQDGESALPLKPYFEQLARSPLAVNVASYTGHGSLRARAMGQDYKRPATQAEIARMQDDLAADLRAGSLGLSTGLEYDPGIYGTPEEVVALAKTAAAGGGRYISHMRSEDVKLDAAIDEIIAIGREAKLPVQISHLKIGIVDRWGEAPKILARLDAARAQGVDITADVYPYSYWQSNLSVLLPERNFEDRAAARFALTKLTTPEGLRIAVFAPDPSLVGKSIAQIAAERHADPVETYLALTRQSEAYRAAHPEVERVDAVIGSAMAEPDIAAFIAWKHSVICSDGMTHGLHPRGFGAFAKILRVYVREQRLLTLEEAVHKMSAQTAAQLGLADRGTIAPGLQADLVLFDPARVADRSDLDHPNALATGVSTVWVNGVVVFDKDAATGARPGQVVRRAGWRPVD
ncbi:amidohydrolase family protein [Caulobacter sp. 602-1]|uniref:N-acyl-D-amino-acid deacylase family protein n=1 Tax=Caulobacter sp. 602-1 TaxID=2492472 RepID=UPI000F641904|nr:D-aminoacylase [Caulobacter sp. 602-1]RRN62165.1 D-aminoacylase [Caulobacter sp. 602-1]